MAEDPTNDRQSYYLVRSSRQIQLDKSVIGVGWDDYRFCDYDDAEKLIGMIAAGTYGIGRHANQVRRYKSIKRGDIIVVPWWEGVVIGVAEDAESYDPSYCHVNGSNQRAVKWFKDDNGQVLFIPRDELSHGLQSRCKIRQTIADLREFADELNEIAKKLRSGQHYSWDSELARREGLEQKSAKDQLLANIQQGKTNLKAGGIGLERVVKELLEAEGFNARVLSKRAFEGIGDADVSATRVNFLREKESYLVQVKHHAGHTSAWGVRQLAAIKDSLPKEYSDHKMVLLTSGRVGDPEVEAYAEQNEIALIDGEQLIEWIFSNLRYLPVRTQRALGLSDVPRLL